ncbi:MAG: esterase/lipase [Paraglaciecola sp.]|jgi:esterase/lipase
MSKFHFIKNIFNHGFVMVSFILLAPLLSAQEYEEPTYNQVDVSQVNKKDMPQKVTFHADDDFVLSANYYLGDTLGGGVLLLHDCSHSSESYNVLGELLAEQGINALAIDFRGYGASESEDFSHQTIKYQVKDIVSYQAEVAMLTSYWEKDVLAAYNYLRNKIGEQQPISLVASGCSVNEAVRLAEKIRINSFVILSPIMDHIEKEHYKNLIDIPAYFVSSADHADSFLTAQELFSWNGDRHSTSQVFQGVDQGHNLLRRNKYLAINLTSWLNTTLN